MVTRWERGAEAEAAVAALLQGWGWQILGRNVRLGPLELDIVARDGRVVAVVEVRCRGAGAFTTGLQSVSLEKRQRVRRAGERLWRWRYRYDRGIDRMRFDVASVTWPADGPRVEYVRAAF